MPCNEITKGGVYMLKRLKNVGGFALTAGVGIISAAPAYAALDLTGVTVDTAPVFTLAGIVVGAIAGIWAIKKVIKLANKS